MKDDEIKDVDKKLKATLKEFMKTKAALAETQARLQALVSYCPAVIYSRDISSPHAVTFISENITFLLGYSVQQFMEDSDFWPSHMHHDDKHNISGHISILSEKGYHACEYRFLHNDGKYRWLQDGMRLEKDETGSPVEIVGFLVDITKRKKAEEELSNFSKGLERQVSQRTGELRDTIMRLTNEINERRRAEDALRESEEKLRKVTTSARDAIIMLDNDGNVSFWNEAAEKMFGYPFEEVSGKNLHKLLAPQRYHEAYQKGYQVFRETGGGPAVDKTVELWAVKKDGLEFPVELSVSAVRLKDEWNAIGIMRDITERKKAEDELLLRGEIIDKMEEGVYLIRTCDGIIVYANPKFEKMFGYEPGKMVGRHVSIVNAPTDKSPEEKAKEIIDCLSRDGIWNGEILNIKKDGTFFWCYSIVSTFEHHKYGNVWLSIHQDITERRKAEDELEKYRKNLEEMVLERTDKLATANRELEVENEMRRQAEDTLLKERNFSDALINSMPGIFYLFDEKGSFVRWNRNFEEVSEYSASEIKSLTPLDFFTGDDKQRISERIGNVFETGQATAEAGFVSKSGRQTPYFFTGLLIKIEDKSYLAGVGIDITERKNADEALRKAMQDLERSNRELEQFAYIASHDLQEPLRMVSSFMQLLSERYKGRFDADADDFIHYAVDGANRMQLMINDLLAYSRVGTKGGFFKVADSNRILEQTLSDMKFPIEETGAVITHDLLPSVTVDATQIAQVFQNLISNAIKFKGDKKSEVHVSAVKKGDEWVFSVKDNGIGFEQKYADRIFDTFKRLHTVAKYPGSGIGLTICRKIIERHGGRIWAESEPGKGSIFYFTIPDKKIPEI